jgi:hypothetical protein
MTHAWPIYRPRPSGCAIRTTAHLSKGSSREPMRVAAGPCDEMLNPTVGGSTTHSRGERQLTDHDERTARLRCLPAPAPGSPAAAPAALAPTAAVTPAAVPIAVVTPAAPAPAAVIIN